MSVWTHTQGLIALRSDVYAPGSKTLAKPNQQLKVTLSRFARMWGKKDGDYRFDCNLYSLPRVKNIIKKAFATLPYGEQGFRYMIHQDDTCGCSSTGANEYERGIAKEQIKKILKNDPKYNYDELAENLWVTTNDIILVGFMNSLRHCYATGLEEAFIKMFLELCEKHHIVPQAGSIKWGDDEISSQTFKLWSYNWGFVIDEFNDGKLVHRKDYHMPYIKGTEEIDYQSFFKNWKLELTEEDFPEEKEDK